MKTFIAATTSRKNAEISVPTTAPAERNAVNRVPSAWVVVATAIEARTTTVECPSAK